MKADWLVVTAHPDDETLHCGGLLAVAAERGEITVTLTLTRGERGRTLGICSQADLPNVRESELRSAAYELGVAHCLVHNLPDGRLEHHEEEATSLVLDALLSWRPRTVVGFPPNGFNGHPDHRAAHRALTTALRHIAGEPTPPRVWLVTSTARFDEPARPGYVSPENVEALRLPATERIDARPVLERKLRAMGCFETQARSTAKILRRYPSTLLEEAFHEWRLTADQPQA